MRHNLTLTVRHWLPIITFCPVNHLPDLIYVSIKFEGFKELYQVRYTVRKLVKFKKLFMEDIAKLIAEEFPDSVQVDVTLLFSRHVVTIKKGI